MRCMVSHFGVTAMRALFLNVSGELVELHRAGASTAVNELKPVTPFGGQSLQNGAVGNVIKERHVFEVGA